MIVLKLSIGSSTTLLAQTATIQGSVRSVLLNEPLVGAAIRSGNNGVVTDYNGDYKLELPAGASTIEVSYIGYISQTKTVELTASQNLTLNFTLEEKNDLMSEVVVVAD
ncbi:MAG TPA: carboxypeptidase-like regulatory domain-containing protein, partial [Chitinophagales bacterium]|nr:carboxypeptidase-like regulatory domain-containing protein [Chitinophagales bacterium]